MTWQTIETAPKDGSNILLCKRAEHGPPWHFYVGSYREKRREWAMFYTNQKLDPSHWRPLPEPPTPG
jgi:hypothetical protein